MNSHARIKIENSSVLIYLLISIGAFLRFYNLNWGAPFYFHPDERNIVDLVLKSSLANPASLLKGTFAYGNFPVILTLFLKPLFLPFFSLFKIIDPFAQTIISLRSISAIFSVLTLYVIYLCGKFWGQKTGLLALFISVFSTGLIQQAHFGTYDGIGAFCALTTFYFLLRFIKTKNISDFYLSLLFIALGAGAKINILILGIFPIFVLLQRLKERKMPVLQVVKYSIISIFILTCLTIILSPYYLTPEFRTSLAYEQGLVRGLIPVFYTQSFFGTNPIIFQFIHILPFLINPLLTLIFIPSFYYLFYKALKTKNAYLLILNSFFLILFLPQAFLFAKWTRYMVPALPFMYLVIALAILDFLKLFPKNKHVFSIAYLVLSVFLVATFLFGISYFITAFVKPDTRIAAATFAGKNFSPNAKILSEPYDLGLMTFNVVSQNTNMFNFYELDADIPASNQSKLNDALANADYVVLPSQRLIRSRLLNTKKFPKGHEFYAQLINEAGGYRKIYESPCDLLCKITYLSDPVFSFEETTSVFERPTVFIYRKIIK